MAVSTFNLRVGDSVTVPIALPPDHAGGLVFLRKRINFAKWRDWSRDVETDSPKAADILQLFNIPKGTKVLTVGTHIEVADSAVTDFDIGDATALDTWIDGGTGAVADVFDDSTDQEAAGVFYATADVIDLELKTGNPTTLVLTVTAACYSYRADG